jgi:hypothetical protein
MTGVCGFLARRFSSQGRSAYIPSQCLAAAASQAKQWVDLPFCCLQQRRPMRRVCYRRDVGTPVPLFPLVSSLGAPNVYGAFTRGPGFFTGRRPERPAARAGPGADRGLG